MSQAPDPYHALFALEYLKVQDPARAARAAGYRHADALAEGKRLLADPQVQALIRGKLQQRGSHAQVSPQQVLHELWSIASADPAELLAYSSAPCPQCRAVEIGEPDPACPACKGQGRPQPTLARLDQISPGARALCRSVEVTPQGGFKLHFFPRTRALELAARSMGMFRHRTQETWPDEEQTRLRAELDMRHADWVAQGRLQHSPPQPWEDPAPAEPLENPENTPHPLQTNPENGPSETSGWVYTSPMQKRLDFGLANTGSATALDSLFHPAVARWFTGRFGVATDVQRQAWAVTAQQRHALIAAPTGSGKTLAAFLAAINDLVVEGLERPLQDEVHVLYISPLKALSNDIQKNLQEPLEGIRKELASMGLPDIGIRDAVRTGDTSATERTLMRRNPPHILVTTPESLFILLTSDSGRDMLRNVRSVIVDELHAVAGSKRGAHLMLSLERLSALTPKEPVRIGLSATQKPIEAMADFLMGNRPANTSLANASPSPNPGEGRGGGVPVSTALANASPSPTRGRAGVGDSPQGCNKASSAEVGDSQTCTIIDTGHVRKRDLALEMPNSPLEAVMSNEVWAETYNRLAELVGQHKTTLIFVNQRRLAERAARALAERIGEEHVTAHHGSLAKEHRLKAEQRLKSGQLKALVATSALELGIDIGDIDLVCQLGSPRSIAAFLQRVGRAGHAVGATPKGRLFPLSADDLLESAALLDSVRRAELDRIHVPKAPLDVLAQQIVAEVACREWQQDELFQMLRRAAPYKELSQQDYDNVVQMLADGYTTKRGRRGAYLHHDAVNRMLRGRRGAKLTVVTNAGVIPDQFDYEVVLMPEQHRVGTLNEDFSFESIPGDIFQLGNTSYRIQKIEVGKVYVEDAKGQPPNLPFWLGEGLGRTDELSHSVSRLVHDAGAMLSDVIPSPPVGGEGQGEGQPQRPEPFSKTGNMAACESWLETELQLPLTAAAQLTNYLAASKAALGLLPDENTIVLERFFDDVGDAHLVIHSSYGSRLNRAWGLALRKRFCRTFNFELQASALEDSIVLSLGPTHSFPLEDIKNYLKSTNVREVLIQALLDAPMFGTRWRWNASIALALKRNINGKRVPPQFQRSDSEDLLTVVFPDQVACAENLTGPREIPDHPLVKQTIDDCLNITMDIAGLEKLLARIERGEVQVIGRDLAGPSPLSHAILSAKPYAFLDDGEAEERRTRAVSAQRLHDVQSAADLGKLDMEAITRVREEASPDITGPDELHDALTVFGFLTIDEIERAGAKQWLPQLQSANRAAIATTSPSPFSGEGRGGGLSAAQVPATEFPPPQAGEGQGGGGSPQNITTSNTIAYAAERLHELTSLLNSKQPIEPLRKPLESADDALREILRSRLELLGPVTAEQLGAPLNISAEATTQALLQLEAEGGVLRGSFTGTRETEWCERRLLARIHRYTRDRQRADIQPVPPSDFMRFLFRWHQIGGSGPQDDRRQGESGLLAALDQLEGFSVPAAAWEEELLPARLKYYAPEMLDRLCASGQASWYRPIEGEAKKKTGPVRATPILLCAREHLPHWRQQTVLPEEAPLSSRAQRMQQALKDHGASFLDDLIEDSGLLPAEAEQALGELVSQGLVTSDSFAGLRGLVMPGPKKERIRHRRIPGAVSDAGRWSLVRKPRATEGDQAALAAPHIEHIARVLLKRYGVVFRKLLEREDHLPPWRELFYVYRRMEARGEIRGGRFVSGFSGEQFALPEAAAALRKLPEVQSDEWVSLSAADPLNLVGIVLPGERVPALTSNRVLLRNGVAAAVQTGDEVRYLQTIDTRSEWEVRNLLIRRQKPGGYFEQPPRAQ